MQVLASTNSGESWTPEPNGYPRSYMAFAPTGDRQPDFISQLRVQLQVDTAINFSQYLTLNQEVPSTAPSFWICVTSDPLISPNGKPIMTMTCSNTAFGLIALLLIFGNQAKADGMVPDTSVVIVHEDDGEASVSVTNSDSQLSLLHVTLQDIPEDTEPLLVVTPPLSRVEASKSQLVRFILQNQKPLLTQRLKRAVFEGMPQGRAATAAGHARVGVTVRQNLPVIVHPKGLAPNRSPWTGLTWTLRDGQLQVRNDTPYVVRLAQELRLLPGDGKAMLPRTYVLPGEALSVPASGGQAKTVRLQPATVYGFAVKAYDAPITL